MTAHSIRYGGYTFTLPQDFNPHFGERLPSLIDIPGVDGASLAFPRGPARAAAGKISLTLKLSASSNGAMQALIDALLTLQDKPLSRLYYTAPGQAARWCMALVDNIALPLDYTRFSYLMLECKISWTVPDPRWLREAQTALPRLDGSWAFGQAGYRIGTGINGNGVLTLPMSGATLTRTLRNEGGVPTHLNLTLNNPAGNASVSSLDIQVNGEGVADRVQPRRALAAGEQLQVNGEEALLRMGGVNLMVDIDAYANPALLRLAPGDNTLTVARAAGVLVNPLTLWLRWNHAWR